MSYDCAAPRCENQVVVHGEICISCANSDYDPRRSGIDSGDLQTDGHGRTVVK